MPRLAGHSRAVLLRERAYAVADTVLPVGELRLARSHTLADLLAPVGWVEAAGGRGSGDGDRGGCHGDAGQQLERERGAGASEQRPRGAAVLERASGRYR